MCNCFKIKHNKKNVLTDNTPTFATPTFATPTFATPTFAAPTFAEPILSMTINPIYNINDYTDLFNTTPENKERIIPNRKSKTERDEEFYNHSKEALKDLDNYLLESSYVFGFE